MLSTRQAARRGLVLAAGAALVGTALVPAASAATDTSTNNTSKKLRQAVTAEGVMEHARALQAIADANGGTRVSGLPGYDASKDYAVDVLEAAGYDVTVQPFVFKTFLSRTPSVLQEVSPTPRTLEHAIMSYSSSGDTTAAAALPTGDNRGCSATDFAGFPAGTIAVISRGACTFASKASNAAAAGASGVVIYNNAPGPLNGTLGDTFTGTLPVVGITQALGQELVAKVPAGLTLRLKTDTLRGDATTYNVLAESTWGDPANVVMAGAHLDSVAAGPGINDNGSGSAAILEVAEQMAKVKPVNKVRFALWGAEESGLVGSNRYVASLTEDQLQKIALYLNFDMIGSPNYVRFVYDGDDSDKVGNGAGPAGSAQIESLFTSYFSSVGLASKGTDFSGRSDYGPFIAKGVPSGGLFTGAEGVKTAEEAAVYGGTAGVAYDVCYHQACDTIANVNVKAIDEMSDAVAHAVLTYAMDTRTVNGEGKGHPVSPPGQATSGTGTAGSGEQGGLHDDHDHDLATM